MGQPVRKYGENGATPEDNDMVESPNNPFPLPLLLYHSPLLSPSTNHLVVIILVCGFFLLHMILHTQKHIMKNMTTPL